MNQIERNPGAFTIWEMLIVIILMGAVGLMMPRIFTTTMRVTRDASAAGNAIATNQTMLEQLRRDAWNADAVTPADDGRSLSISVAHGEIRWVVQPKLTDNGMTIDVTRGIGAEQRSWNVAAETLRFERSPAGALVRFGPPPTSDDSILLVSQLSHLKRLGGGGGS